jgi:hypothetical protein
MCMYGDRQQYILNSNDSNISIVMCSSLLYMFWVNKFLTGTNGTVKWIQFLSRDTFPFLYNHFLSGFLFSFLSPLWCSARMTMYKMLLKLWIAEGTPTVKTTRIVYMIPNHDQFYHHNCRGLPSPSQAILPTLLLLSLQRITAIKQNYLRSRVLIENLTVPHLLTTFFTFSFSFWTKSTKRIHKSNAAFSIVCLSAGFTPETTPRISMDLLPHHNRPYLPVQIVPSVVYKIIGSRNCRWTDTDHRVYTVKTEAHKKMQYGQPTLDISLSLLSPVVTLCTTGFNIHKFYVLPTQCIYVFYMNLRTNSDYFPKLIGIFKSRRSLFTMRYDLHPSIQFKATLVFIGLHKVTNWINLLKQCVSNDGKRGNLGFFF